MTQNSLVHFDTAKRELVLATTIDEVKNIRDKAEALRAYAKQAGESLEMQNMIAEIKIRAERKAGELLKEIPKETGKRVDLTSSVDSTKLQSVGISRNQSSDWQKIADIPEDKFEKHIAEMKDSKEELTTASVIKLAKETKREEIKEQAKEAEPIKGKYRIIYADPPWAYGNTMPEYFGEQADHYPVMSIKELSELQIQDITEDNAVLFLWVTSPILEEVFGVIKAWGFQYKSSFIWDKIKHNMGHYNSVRHELLLICTKGSCMPDTNKLHDSVVSIERTEHSVKPEYFRTLIESLYTYGNKIELFARIKSDGWETFGNEL